MSGLAPSTSAPAPEEIEIGSHGGARTLCVTQGAGVRALRLSRPTRAAAVPSKCERSINTCPPVGTARLDSRKARGGL